MNERQRERIQLTKGKVGERPAESEVRSVE